MIGRMLSVGLDTNPIIVDYSDNMPKYLKEQYLGMFVKYTGNSTDEYEKNNTYQVSKKQDGTDTVYFFAPYFNLETLDNPADSSRVIDGYQAYNDKGEKLEGQYKLSEKVITANGTYYPTNDNVNAYNKVTVNVGETAENPYVATTDSEMQAYLAAEYKDSFVRMDYAKYYITLPATATATTAIFKCENIGIPRTCSYIDKWLGTDNQNTILELKTTNGSFTYTTTAYKVLNVDNTYGYAIAFTFTVASDSGSSSSTTPLFLYNIKNGTEIGEYTADQDWYIGWTYLGDANELIAAALSNFSASYTIAVSNALILTNMAGSEADNEYIEGGVYKVATKYVENNNYVAESPFEVGDALSGAIFYINQQLTYEEFTTMFNTVPSDEFNSLPAYIFLNYDNPYEISDTQGYGALTPPALLRADGANLLSYGASMENPYIFDANMQPTDKASMASFVMAASIEIEGETINTPVTITKINKPDIFNAIFGKTANFTKQSTVEESYVFDLQLSNGAFEEAQSETKLDAKATNDNIGKVYQYTGTTGTKYTNQALYIVMED